MAVQHHPDRRNRTSATGRGVGVWAFLLALCTAGALAHVAVRMHSIQIAYALGRERRTNTELAEQRRRLNIEIGMLKDPDRVIGIAREKLGMGPPAPRTSCGWTAGRWCRRRRRAARGARGRDRAARKALEPRREGGETVDHPLDARPHRRVRRGAGAVLFLAVGKRAFTLQVRDADRLRGMAEEQYLREIELPPRRGRILDRNGAELASTADVDSIYCNPRQLPDPRDAARRLARILGLDRADLEKKLGQRRFFAWVKRKVTPDEVTAVKALGLPGIAFTREPRRFYPEPDAGGDDHGARGLGGERPGRDRAGAGRQLRGTSSSVQGMRDALGRDIAVEGTGDAAELGRAATWC